MRRWPRRTRRPRPPTGSPARSRRGATSWSRRRSTRSARGCPCTATPTPHSPRTSSGTSGRTTTCCAACCAAAGPPEVRDFGSSPATPRCAPAAGSRSPTSSRRSAATTTSSGTRCRRRARRRAPADEALAVAGSVLRYVDLAATEASAAFLEAQQLLLADSDRVRRDLLEDLLAGRDPESAAGLAAARDAGLDGTARCAASSRRCRPRRRRTTARCGGAANALATALGAARTRPLTVTRHGEIVLVRAVAEGERPALVAPLERACARAGEPAPRARRRREHGAARARGARRRLPRGVARAAAAWPRPAACCRWPTSRRSST